MYNISVKNAETYLKAQWYLCLQIQTLTLLMLLIPIQCVSLYVMDFWQSTAKILLIRDYKNLSKILSSQVNGLSVHFLLYVLYLSK